MRYALCLLLLSASCGGSGTLHADQNAPELNALFEQLADAPDSGAAAELEARIWQRWLEAPDEQTARQLGRVVVALQSGDHNQALEFADELVESAPDYAEAWNKRATIHYMLGNYDESVADIGETLAREPRHFGAISGLGLIFLRQGDLEAALQAFEEVLRISPKSASAMQSAARVRQELGRDI